MSNTKSRKTRVAPLSARRLLSRHDYTTMLPRGAVQIKFIGSCHPDLLHHEFDSEGGVFFNLYGRRVAKVDGSGAWAPLVHNVSVFEDEDDDTNIVFTNPSPSGAVM